MDVKLICQTIGVALKDPHLRIGTRYNLLLSAPSLWVCGWCNRTGPPFSRGLHFSCLQFISLIIVGPKLILFSHLTHKRNVEAQSSCDFHHADRTPVRLIRSSPSASNRSRRSFSIRHSCARRYCTDCAEGHLR
jgi:hypothetical protein